ncbi:MAG: hypothetical protein ACLQDI_01965, partial [Syntrophobacteraceae bacterium]
FGVVAHILLKTRYNPTITQAVALLYTHNERRRPCVIVRSMGGPGMIFRRGELCAHLEMIRMTGKEWHTSQRQVHAEL